MNGAGFDDWLRDRHAQMVTPASLVEACVRKATGNSVRSSSRVVHGQMNEVHDITTDKSQHVIVRISHASDPRFEAERWALDAARRHGVPTPEVFLVEDARNGDEVITVCVEEKLIGVPLDQLLKRAPAHSLGIDIAHIGAALAGIHDVRTEGFGYLQPDGKGWPITFRDIMLDLNTRTDELKRAARHWNVPVRKINAGVELLNEHEDLYGWQLPGLVHGDFTADHILVHDGKITGVIDFQDCSGNHPVLDFVQWDVTSRSLRYPITLRSLISAYPNKDVFGDDFMAIFNLALLRHCLWMLMVHVEQENPHGLRGIVQALDRALRFG